MKEFLLGVLSVPKSFIQTAIKVFSKQSSTLIKRKQELPSAALITPILSLVVIAVVNFESVSARVHPMVAAMLGFVISSLYAAFLVKPREAINLFTGALVEGIQDVAGVMFLFMGIGMLVTASTHSVIFNAQTRQTLKILGSAVMLELTQPQF